MGDSFIVKIIALSGELGSISDFVFSKNLDHGCLRRKELFRQFFSKANGRSALFYWLFLLAKGSKKKQRNRSFYQISLFILAFLKDLDQLRSRGKLCAV